MSDLTDGPSGSLLTQPRRRSRRCLVSPLGYHGRFLPRDKWICMWCGRDIDAPDASSAVLGQLEMQGK